MRNLGNTRNRVTPFDDNQVVPGHHFTPIKFVVKIMKSMRYWYSRLPFLICSLLNLKQYLKTKKRITLPISMVYLIS
jgi:hypothetical protein